MATVTGVDFAFVNFKAGPAPVEEGGEVDPKLVPAGEMERLEALGVFGEHPRVARQAELDRLVAAGLASHGLTPERAEEEKNALVPRIGEADEDEILAFVDDATVAGLRAFADVNELDLGGATRKADVRTAIEDALASEK